MAQDTQETEEMKWAVGITTAPRKDPTLEQCVCSTVQAGWEPVIYAEPGTDLSNVSGLSIVQREERFGAWHNWYAMCFDLLDRFPEAEAILTIQDDTEFVVDCREFVEGYLWPKDCGFVSLYTPKHYSQRWEVWKDGEKLSNHLSSKMAKKAARENKGKVYTADKPVGLNRHKIGSLWGACALVFPRKVLKRLVNSRVAKKWKGVRFKRRKRKRESHEVANVDTAVGRIVKNMKKEMYFFTPSLSHHIAKHSTIGHGDNKGRRNSIDFPGVDADLEEVFLPLDQPWMTEAEREEIKRSLKPDMTVLEWGSGGSTLEFSPLVSQYFSIEHDPKWFSRVLQNAPENVQVVYSGLENGYAGKCSEFGQTFDAVLIDGRKREECVKSVLPYLNDGSRVYVHDWKRYRESEEFFQEGCRLLKVVDDLAVFEKMG